jgi:hypothetical protein
MEAPFSDVITTSEPPAVSRLSLDVRPLPYTLRPEELSFVKSYHAEAIQRRKADGSVVIDSANMRCAVRGASCLRPPARATLRFMLRLKVRNLTEHALDVLLPRGSFWHAAREWQQPLLLISNTSVSIKPRGVRVLEVPAIGGASAYHCSHNTPMELSAYQLVATGDAADALRSQQDLWRWLKSSLLIPVPASATADGPIASTLPADRRHDQRCRDEDGKARSVAAATQNAQAEAALAAARAVVDEARRRQAADERAALDAEARAREARAKEEYAVVELSGPSAVAPLVRDAQPDWFVALSPAERAACIKADGLGDWEAFEAWLHASYDADELDGFEFDEEALDIYEKFAAERQKHEEKLALQAKHPASGLARPPRSPRLSPLVTPREELPALPTPRTARTAGASATHEAAAAAARGEKPMWTPRRGGFTEAWEPPAAADEGGVGSTSSSQRSGVIVTLNERRSSTGSI